MKIYYILFFICFQLIYFYYNVTGQELKITADDAVGLARFGHSVSISGDYLVVGSIMDSPNGSAYIYYRNQGGTNNWGQTHKLSASDASVFGNSVSIDGDYIIVGAPYTQNEKGSAYIYYRNEGGLDNWGLQAQLFASDSSGGDRFGTSVCISDTLVIVGAELDDHPGSLAPTIDAGSAYIFSRSNTTWNERNKIIASDSSASDFFGSSVAIDGNNVLIGAYGDDDLADQSGAAYFYSRQGSSWIEESKIVPSQAGPANFGRSVSLRNNTAVIGAPQDHDGSFIFKGASYIYVWDMVNWNFEQKIFSSDGSAGDNFGFSVSIGQNILLVGAFRADHTLLADPGAVYSFLRTNSVWRQRKKEIADDAAANDWFGFSVGIDSLYSVVGARDADLPGAVDAGAGYVYYSIFNDPPTANIDSAITVEDTAIEFNATQNDSDTNGDAISLYSIIQGANGVATIQNDSMISYLPNINYFGLDNFYYVLVDSLGATDTATVTVTVGSVNDPPVAVDDVANTNEDVAVVINVLSNDSDSDGVLVPSSVLVTSGPANGGTSVNTTTGAVTYTPNSQYNGIDTFTYTVEDDSGAVSNAATVTVTVISVNDPPVAVDDAATTDEEVAVVINVLSNDSDSDGVLVPSSVLVTGGPSNGGTSVNTTTGAVTYTPNSQYNGIDTFTYTVEDDSGAVSNAATVTVTVISVNDPPVAVNDAADTDEEVAVVINVLSNDSDSDGVLIPSSVLVTSGPSNGGTSVNTTTGAVTYTPNAQYHGQDIFTYTVEDDSGAVSNTATVTVTVSSVNDPPVAVNDAADTDEEVAVVINVLSNDSDSDGLLIPSSVLVTSGPSNGGTNVNTTTGAVTYTPNAQYHGQDIFTYTVEDDSGAVSNAATVTVTVSSVNDPPVAVDDAADTDEEVAVVINVLSNDSDSDGVLIPSSVMVTSGPSNGGTSVNTTTGAVTYTPNSQYNGIDTFTYTVEDDSGAVSNAATVTVTVSSVNDPPVAVDDAADTDEEVAVVINVLSNDSDSDGVLIPSSVMVTSGPSNGGTSVNTTTGAVTYTPNSQYNGIDTFTYTVEDDSGAVSNAATVTVTIDSVNDAPVIILPLPELVFNEDDSLIYPILNFYNYVTDPDHPDSMLFYELRNGNNITVTPDSQIFTIKSPANWFGTDTLELSISDGELSDTAEVFVTVNPINDAPMYVNWPDTIRFTDLSDTVLTMIDYVNDIDSPDTNLTWQIGVSDTALNWQFDFLTTELTLTAPGFNGIVLLYCTVTDDSLSSVMDSIAVKVVADPTGIDDIVNLIPDKYFLHQNFPNPFNPVTKIEYGLPHASKVKLEIYNVIGQKVFSFVHELKSAGIHSIEFDGQSLSSGIYFYHFQAREFSKVRKMILLK